MLARLRSMFRAWRSRGEFEDGMGEELRFHIEHYAADLERSGLSPGEAARRARIEFGSVGSVREECREARWLHIVDGLQRQTRHAFRSLRKTPQFTVTALVTLAVCLGANLTIFAVVDSILLRPLPFPGAGRLVTIFNTYPKAGVLRDGSSITNYYERRGRLPAFSSVALYREETAIVGDSGAAASEAVMRVSPDFFATLGVGPMLGRGFTEDEMRVPQDGRPVVVTDGYWRQHLGADPLVLGRKVRIDGVSNVVVGVLPAGFRFLSSEAILYLPYATRAEERLPGERHSGGNSRQMIARLKEGVAIEQAQAQVDAQNNALEVDDPQGKMMADAGFRSLVVPLQGDHVEGVRPALLWTQAGALALLLISAVNLANLLLVRAGGRTKELAVRQALGAGRMHVVSEVVVETMLLALAGGVLGMVAGWGGIRVLAALGAERLPLGARIAFDPRLAGAALVGSVALGIALALPIAWFHLRGQVAVGIQCETRGGTASRGSQRLRHVFIVAQIAMALVLLTGTGLMGLSLKNVLSISPGFRPDHVISGQISLPRNDYPDGATQLAFNRQLMEGLARQPGVAAVGFVNNVPLSGHAGKSAAMVVGHVQGTGESARGNYSYGVDGDYFAAMGFSLVEGRFLSAADSRRSGRVCVVDRDFANYYWPNGSALGQRLFEGSEAGKDVDAFTVVGVVGAVKQAGLAEDAAEGAIYYPYAFRTDDHLFVVVRTSVAPESFGRTLQGMVRQIGPGAAINDVRSMDSRISDSLVARRAPSMLAALFSGIALLLTAVGTYGILSYAVAQRRHEIAIRMALGARPGQIGGQYLGLGTRLVMAGTVLGVLGSWFLGQAMRGLLFHVPPFPIATVAGAVCVVGAVALAACLMPSLRAARISPARALSDE